MICPHSHGALAAAFAALSGISFSSADAGQDLLALDSLNRFVRVSVANDGSITAAESAVTITGLAGGETIGSIAIDPATGNLLAYSSTDHCYIVDKTTGATTDLGGLSLSATDSARFVDFDPPSGHLRVVGDQSTNLELDPDTLAVEIVGFAPSFAVGDLHEGTTPRLAGSTFSNSYPGSQNTQAYAIDSENDVLAYHSGLNGDLYTIGDLGVDATLDGGLAMDLAGRMFAALRAEGESESRLYSVNFDTGALTDLGSLLDGDIVKDVAFDLDPTSDDLDEDGWPNDIEIAGAANFADPNSTPFPSATKVPFLSLAPALSQKLRIKLRFSDPEGLGDRIVVKGKLPVGESTFSPAGKTLIVDVGGVTAHFVLDAKGRATSALGYTIDLENTVGLGGVKFKLEMEGGAFQQYLTDEGLIDGTFVDHAATVQIDFWMSNLHARESCAVEYTATLGGSGVAH